MSTAWHVSRPVVELYATGGLDHAAEASAEMHLTSCGTCREVVSGLFPAPDVEELWEGVRAEIAAPGDPWLVRLLRRLGLPDADAVILTASPAPAPPGPGSHHSDPRARGDRPARTQRGRQEHPAAPARHSDAPDLGSDHGGRARRDRHDRRADGRPAADRPWAAGPGPGWS